MKKEPAMFRKALQFFEFIDDERNDNIKLLRKNCHCLPPCTVIKYDGEIYREQYQSKHKVENNE